MRGLMLTTVTLALISGPAAAQDPACADCAPVQRLTLGGVFADASLEVKLVMAALLLAALGAIGAWILGLARPAARAGALNFVKGVRTAAPLAGVTCGGFVMLMMFIATANVRPAPTMTILAPGYAEVALAVMLGFFAATIAAVAERHLVGRAAAEA